MGDKRLAKEWLLLIGGVFFGLLIFWPMLLIILASNQQPVLDRLKKVFGVLLGDEGSSNAIAACLFTLAPYLLVQLLRSIVWAIRTVRS